MSSLPFNPSDRPTVEAGVNALLTDAKQKVRSRYGECEQCVRESPTKAILVAVAAGYCLHRLPIRSILVTQVRLMAALAPPTLLAFGAAKLCEFLQGQARKRPSSSPMLRHAGELHDME